MTLLAGALVVVGLLGVVLPLVPGSPLVGLGVLVWALGERTTTGWVVLAVAVVLLAAGVALSYLGAGRSVVRAGVPARSLALAAVLAVVGALTVPVVGLPLGFVVGLHLAELVRLGPGRGSARSTLVALRAVVVGVGVELGFAATASVAWLVAVLA